METIASGHTVLCVNNQRTAQNVMLNAPDVRVLFAVASVPPHGTVVKENVPATLTVFNCVTVTVPDPPLLTSACAVVPAQAALAAVGEVEPPPQPAVRQIAANQNAAQRDVMRERASYSGDLTWRCRKPASDTNVLKSPMVTHLYSDKCKFERAVTTPVTIALIAAGHLLIERLLIDVIDHNHGDRCLLFHELEPELALNRLEHRYAVRDRRVYRPGG